MQLFCIIYYVCSYLYYFPAIIKLIKTKSSNDYSLSSEITGLIAVISWTIYIFSTKQDLVVYIGTVIDLILCCLLGFLIFKYYKKERKN